ncbi:hypothetical protein [Blastochloris sulfoviridis]|uniref:Uncharacterized protein n=1 Tax=Blastochloris sulfoviridis TaxID=50712 RepID=A0A5M6I6G4_9HYPH|nr:hypothetical protein [Blastochloris sulfoviridis]KAA5603425.1 hypothetical protein F1193_01910 [Blastochloris sulfoviridis]
MDQEILVSGGHALVKAMDDSGLTPRLAMWVHNTDTDTWKLWLAPPPGLTDKHNFYRKLSEIVSKNRNQLSGLESSDTEMISDSHPAVKGLKTFINAPGLSNIAFKGNMFNGFYLPDGIIIRSDL